MTPFQEFIYTRTYSRWLDDKQRRETWNETVIRYGEFFQDRLRSTFEQHPHIEDDFWDAILDIYRFSVMPSMRALWTAGEALRRENAAGYNCSALVVDNPKAFSEALYLLMCGAGVGFSVERQFVNQLSTIPEQLIESSEVIIFGDSKQGWAEGYKQFIDGLYSGLIYQCDYSLIRPKGAKLKVFGGRASGKEPFISLVNFTKQTFVNAKGRKLNSLECHDLMCYVASIVVVGGVRRASCISLSNLSDKRMAHAKDGEFWLRNAQRNMANNSVAYTEKPDTSAFLEEWLNLMRSQSGERGIFNREGVKRWMKINNPERDTNYNFCINPCAEIVLRPDGMCNLTEVVVRKGDSLDDLKKKIESATILGCVQATLIDFNFLSDTWKQNAEDERLLGVSLTGLRDHDVLKTVNDTARLWLTSLRLHAKKTAIKWAGILNINVPKSICCVKPSGTVGLLVNSAPGLHTRFSPYYIRRVRIAKTDPLCALMIDQGVPWTPETGQNIDNYNTAVFEFPIKAPEGAITNDDVTAIESLEYWKMLRECYCDHNASVTIYVSDHEWIVVGNWVYENWDSVVGIAFLPKDNSVYLLAPYEAITEQEYSVLVGTMPKINFNELTRYELEDQTEGSRELACSGGSCELR